MDRASLCARRPKSDADVNPNSVRGEGALGSAREASAERDSEAGVGRPVVRTAEPLGSTMEAHTVPLAAILAGGKSRRMGREKGNRALLMLFLY